MANLVILKGRLTKDVEMRTLQNENQTKVANFSIAVDRKFKAEGQPTADFFNCVSWGKQAEFINNYFGKGKEIYLTGRLQTRSWETESGEKRYATDIIVENVEFCGSKQESSHDIINVIEDNKSDELPF